MDHLQKTKKDFKETGDPRYFIKTDMAYGEFKNLTRRTASDEILRDKAFNIAKNQQYDDYQCRLASNS